MATEKRPQLKAEKRKITGRKVKQLRREGILPANVYGKDLKSLAIQVKIKEFQPVFRQRGETGLLDLAIVGEDKARPVLIHNLQIDPLADTALHVDFHQVSLKEKISAKIPLVLVGEAPIIKEKGGILIQPLNEIEVEALPTDLPEKIEVNVGNLKAVDEAITVGELKVGDAVKVLAAAKEVVAKIEPLAKEEVVTPPPTEEAAPTEGEAPPAERGEGKAEEVKPSETAGPAESAAKPQPVKPAEERK